MEAKVEFEEFLSRLAVQNASDISTSYKGVTKKLNKTFHGIDSEERNSLQVGSYGRKTAINGISDLDMLFELPRSLYDKYDSYDSNGQSALLQDVKKSLQQKYPDSDIKGDGQVVVFNHSNCKIEVLPCFGETDGKYTYPDTNNNGSWKKTNPKPEIRAINELDKESGGVLKKLCKMVRSWKDNVGAPINGYLIDTLCYNFIRDNKTHHNISYSKYGELCKAFFEYLAKTDKDKNYWLAPGSGDRAFKKGNFVPKARKAQKLCSKALENEGKEKARKFWKRVFGRKFPNKKIIAKSESRTWFKDTEEFIEDKFPVNIREDLSIECYVQQDGFRKMLLSRIPLLKHRYSLEFYVKSTTVVRPYRCFWKVRNVGAVAERKNQIRGKIVEDKGKQKRNETSSFDGDHYVECYIIKNGTVVARDAIDVTIKDLEDS